MQENPQVCVAEFSWRLGTYEEKDGRWVGPPLFKGPPDAPARLEVSRWGMCLFRTKIRRENHARRRKLPVMQLFRPKRAFKSRYILPDVGISCGCGMTTVDHFV